MAQLVEDLTLVARRLREGPGVGLSSPATTQNQPAQR